VFLGRVDLADARPPWEYLERMGDAHFASTAGYRVTLVEHHPRPLVTVVMLWSSRWAEAIPVSAARGACRE
jgi:hypothetical protein